MQQGMAGSVLGAVHGHGTVRRTVHRPWNVAWPGTRPGTWPGGCVVLREFQTEAALGSFPLQVRLHGTCGVRRLSCQHAGTADGVGTDAGAEGFRCGKELGSQDFQIRVMTGVNGQGTPVAAPLYKGTALQVWTATRVLRDGLFLEMRDHLTVEG